MIENYISYYNSCRVQHNLGVPTPMEKHEYYRRHNKTSENGWTIRPDIS